ncbi:MAG: methyltransferase domain-containing protein [Rhodospirillaceae bacterium]|nr:methyltransferase domain-containing protein [Rhodospirillaceae bacterium]
METRSGDPIADARLAMALQWRARGETAAAVELIVQALELAPRWAEARYALAETLAMLGRRDEAQAAMADYLALDPADSMGAAALAHRLNPDIAPILSAAFVRRLFDQYAPTFDHTLTGALNYTAPAQLRAALDAVAPGRRFARALDLGCGTGLMGAAVRDRVDHLAGCDLSPGMIAVARGKGLYDALEAADLVAALAAARALDLILAADVFVYVGDLAPVFDGAFGAAAPGALFGFTLQRSSGADVALGDDRRFAHRRGHIEHLAAGAGWRVAVARDAVCRHDQGRPVPGLLVMLQK